MLCYDYIANPTCSLDLHTLFRHAMPLSSVRQGPQQQCAHLIWSLMSPTRKTRCPSRVSLQRLYSRRISWRPDRPGARIERAI